MIWYYLVHDNFFVSGLDWGTIIFLALCLSAGRGVPLHTLMLITITKRKCLTNGYSVVKELSRFRHTKENRQRFLSLHLFPHLEAKSSP